MKDRTPQAHWTKRHQGESIANYVTRMDAIRSNPQRRRPPFVKDPSPRFWVAFYTLIAIFLYIVIALLPAPAHAESGDTSVIVHGLSHHTKPRAEGRQWNETNTGIGLRYEFTDDISIQGGVYKNSINKQSIYGSLDYTPFSQGPFHFGGYAGVANGYENGKARIGGGGLVRWQEGRHSVSLRATPAKSGGLVFSIEYGVRF